MRSESYSLRICKAFMAWLMTCAASTAATFTIQGSAANSLNLHLDSDPLSYFYLEQSTNLENFTPFSMVLGNQETVWPLSSEDVPTRFFSVTKISLFAPEDTDGDGIDDVYELRHPILNPLDASDAAFPSRNGNLTYLQEYRSVLGVDTGPPEVFSREITSFNFGNNLEAATSREISIFNLGPPLFRVESQSREISVYNGGDIPMSEIAEVYSREISAFNFAASFNSADSISRQISVFNGDPAPPSEILVTHSREVSAFNFGAPLFADDVSSREISTFNFRAQYSTVDIISRELSVINTAP